MKWCSTLSELPETEEALDEALFDLQEQLGEDRPSLIFLFVSAHHRGSLQYVVDELNDAFPAATLLGCTGGGIMGGGLEIEGRSGLSMTAAVLPDVVRVPFHLNTGQVQRRAAAPLLWQERLDMVPEQQPIFILFLEPFSCDPSSLIRSLDLSFPGCTKVGGVASGGNRPGGQALIMEDSVLSEGVVGVALYGDIAVDALVAQGCRPVGPSLKVTECAGNLLVRLDGRPVLDVVAEVVRSLGPRDGALFGQSPMIGLGTSDGEFGGLAGEYLVRNLLGVDRAKGTVAVGGAVEEGQSVRFHVRDAAAAALELSEMLERTQRGRGGEAPDGALCFSCLGRGTAFFGKTGHDTGLVHDKMGPVPMGGIFCYGEIGPVHGSTWLHAYTSALAFFRSRGWS